MQSPMKTKIEIKKDMHLFIPHTEFLSDFLTSVLSFTKDPRSLESNSELTASSSRNKPLLLALLM